MRGTTILDFRKEIVMKKTISVILICFLILNTLSLTFAATSVQPSKPSGYTYYRSYSGNSDMEMAISGTLLAGTGFVPGFTLISYLFTGVYTALAALDGSSLPAKYTDYIYTCDNPGMYPYIYWHKIKYVVEFDDDGDGIDESHTIWESYYEYALMPSPGI
jgi:hypothetical protein